MSLTTIRDILLWRGEYPNLNFEEQIAFIKEKVQPFVEKKIDPKYVSFLDLPVNGKDYDLGYYISVFLMKADFSNELHHTTYSVIGYVSESEIYKYKIIDGQHEISKKISKGLIILLKFEYININKTYSVSLKYLKPRL